jgi:hypothetical protein
MVELELGNQAKRATLDERVRIVMKGFEEWLRALAGRLGALYVGSGPRKMRGN